MIRTKKQDKLPDITEQEMLHALNDMGGISLYDFLQIFWKEVSQDKLELSWYMEYLCNEVQKILERVGNKEKKLHDLLINIPPGTTKTTIVSIMAPAYAWTRWYWMRFVCASSGATLSLESAEKCRDIVRSEKYRRLWPEIGIKEDKDQKSNFRVVKKVVHVEYKVPRQVIGGGRFSTSVGAKTLGFHGHVLIWDDAVDPSTPHTTTDYETTNNWLHQKFGTRKTDKRITTIIGIMQRLHQIDPSGFWLAKKKKNLKHICLPGEIKNYGHLVQPKELIQHYQDGLLDPRRMDWEVLQEMEADLGQYGYAGQVGQDPSPPKGGMFEIDKFIIIDQLPHEINFEQVIRYWDKAGTSEAELKKGQKAAYTVGCKLIKLVQGDWIISDVVRGRWGSLERENMVRKVAEADGYNVKIYHEQEPGSGGKDSAKATTLNLAGFQVERDLPVGDKTRRADPYSVQVNAGNIRLLRGSWNDKFLEEHRYFPFSTFKDQVDAASGAFAKSIGKKKVKSF